MLNKHTVEQFVYKHSIYLFIFPLGPNALTSLPLSLGPCPWKWWSTGRIQSCTKMTFLKSWRAFLTLEACEGQPWVKLEIGIQHPRQQLMLGKILGTKESCQGVLQREVTRINALFLKSFSTERKIQCKKKQWRWIAALVYWNVHLLCKDCMHRNIHNEKFLITEQKKMLLL